MGNDEQPTLGNGKICYVEMPAIDIKASASFYKDVFGWRIRERGDGSTAFDDAVGQVSGTWVLGRKASTELGLLIYIMVDSVATTIKAIISNGCSIVQPIGMDAPEVPPGLVIRRETSSASINNRRKPVLTEHVVEAISGSRSLVCPAGVVQDQLEELECNRKVSLYLSRRKGFGPDA